MKLSEQIREAVDTKLAATEQEWIKAGMRFNLATVISDFMEGAANYPSELISEILVEVDRDSAMQISHIPSEFEIQQGIRFMYAEFLALYFEDDEEAEELAAAIKVEEFDPETETWKEKQ